MSKIKRLNKVQESLEDIHGLPCVAIDGNNMTHNRMITLETAKHFGIRTLFDESQQKVTGYYFPVTKKGEVTGYIKVNLNVPKKSDGRFSVVGDVSIDCDLVGQSVAPKDSKRKLWIVEGVWDMAIAWQCLKEGGEEYLRKQGKQQELCPAVVTFPLGIGDPTKQEVTNARRALGQNIEFIEGYQELYTCFDNDSITDENVGQLGVQDCALVLKDFKNILLKHNDISDTYKYEGTGYTYKQLMFEGKIFEIGAVRESISDDMFDNALKPIAKGVKLSILPRTMDMLNGLRGGEFTILLAPPKCGKTTLLKLINLHLLKAGKKSFGVYLEDDINKVYQSFIAMYCDVHLPKFRQNPSIADPNKVQEAKELLQSGNAMFFDDKEGKMTPENVIQQFEWAAIKGVKYILFDHLSFVFSGDRKGDERKGIDNLVTDIATFVKRTGVHVIAVAHITYDKNRPKPKNKDGTIKYPYWYEVEEHDGRGSSIFAQACWNMIAIDKQVTEDKTRGYTRTKILFNREWDVTGIADTLTLNPLTGQLEVARLDEEEY